jgi:hypothetical protein
MHKSDQCAEPPCRASDKLEGSDIDQRKHPAVDEMQKNADQLCPVTIWSDHGAQQIRHIHPGHAHALTAC